LVYKKGLQSGESCVECAVLAGWWFDSVGGSIEMIESGKKGG